VTTVHLVGSELEARGFGPQLLAAVFPFEGGGFDEMHATRPVSPPDTGGWESGSAARAKDRTAPRVYWIYGFKRGAFWPFVPTGEGHERDNPEELELKAKLEKELPIEPDLTRWFGVFDAPV
jgi:hypothetical protein